MRPPDHDVEHADVEARAALSPSLAGDGATTLPAFEQKFLIDEATAAAVVATTREQLRLDPHADGSDGAYSITTLYLDTPGFDVFHEAKALEGAKYRVRRYGHEAKVWLERKTRRGDRVWKRRTAVPIDAPQTGASWFHDEVRARDFRPVLAVAYRRAAYFGSGDQGPFRLTLDREITGTPRGTWDLSAVTSGTPLEPERVVCELKFRDALPSLFKQMVAALKLTPTKFSKYRRLLLATGVVAAGTTDAP
jgi:hypothetical protein